MTDHAEQPTAQGATRTAKKKTKKKKTKQQLGKMSRNKGASFERLIAKQLCEIGIEARRTGWAQAQNKSNAPDVEAKGLPLWIECSVGTRPSIEAKVAQAVDAAPPTNWAIAFTKKDRGPILATMPADDFLDLLQEWFQTRN